ncbi:MAG: phosphotransferase [Thermoanaerobaculum sp.]
MHVGDSPDNPKLPPAFGEKLLRLGLSPSAWEPLAADASVRRLFRLSSGRGQSAVLMLYPPEATASVSHHAAVFRWAARRGLPVPKLLAETAEGLLVEDLGSCGAREALATDPEAGQVHVLSVLAAFQAYQGPFTLNLPFDQDLFMRELQQFLDYSGLRQPVAPAVLEFCRFLASELATHPYRLCHRDFHLDNLIATPNGFKAVDFQDLRLGPDTYDAASLLRERGGTTRFPADFLAKAAKLLGWEGNWQARFTQCAAQRGLKALGTFLRLASLGRSHYRTLIPEVAANAWQAVLALGGPTGLLAVLEKLSTGEGL